MSKNIAVFIGRFQPFHEGHKHVIETALARPNIDGLIVIIGGYNSPRTARDPYTYFERRNMIDSVFKNQVLSGKIKIVGVTNRLYNDTLWANDVRKQVAAAYPETTTTFTLVGYAKDASSYYLNMFPEWSSMSVEPFSVNTSEGARVLSATDIRKMLYAGAFFQDIPGVIQASHNHLIMLTAADAEDLRLEYEYIENYKKSWASAPFPPIFVTVDAVVVRSGHVLMITRREHPGKGLLALPGGFVNQFETIDDARIRELIEETSIDVSERALKRLVTKRQVFDSPYRSQRGRTITHAGLIELSPDLPFPRVRGADDAASAAWYPIASLSRRNIYEDHADITEYMTGTVIS